MRLRRACLLVLALALAACGSSSSASTTVGVTIPLAPATSASGLPTTTTEVPTTVAPTTTTAPVAAPDQFGPFAVGRTTITATDTARSRPLTMDVWYPVSAGTTGKAARYEFTPTIAYDSTHALDKPTLAAGGPFPMVVYSHGSGGVRYIATYYTELLASHGFVVVAPDHTGNTATDSILGTKSDPTTIATNRIADVRFVIDEMLRRSTATGDPLFGSVDPQRIGLSGHSFGGFTAFADAGGITAPGITTVPADTRVKAVFGMAPYTQLIPDASLAAVSVPTMIVVGTKDVTTPPATDSDRPFATTVGRPSYLVKLTGAGHQSFTDVCYYQTLVPTLPNIPPAFTAFINSYATEGCGPDLMAIDRAHSLANTYGVAFLETYVAKVPGYDTFLSDAHAASDADVVFAAKR